MQTVWYKVNISLSFTRSLIIFDYFTKYPILPPKKIIVHCRQETKKCIEIYCVVIILILNNDCVMKMVNFITLHYKDIQYYLSHFARVIVIFFIDVFCITLNLVENYQHLKITAIMFKTWSKILSSSKLV